MYGVFHFLHINGSILCDLGKYTWFYITKPPFNLITKNKSNNKVANTWT
jgi:hypothetical protein